MKQWRGCCNITYNFGRKDSWKTDMKNGTLNKNSFQRKVANWTEFAAF
jgi:hypothetical protein